MRSTIFAALAFGGLDLVAAGLCKPSLVSGSVTLTGTAETSGPGISGASETSGSGSAGTLSGGSETATFGTTSSTSGVSELTGTIGLTSTSSGTSRASETQTSGTSFSTSASESTGTIGTTDSGTLTSTIVTSTTSPPVVTNEVANGNFVAYDPNSRNGIYAFNSEGDARLVQGNGYQGDGSQETGCVVLGSQTNSKRQATDWNAMIEQQLEDLNVANLYTVRFFYAILDNTVADTCRINAYYGDDIFASTPYFPVVATTPSQMQWLEFVNQAAVQTASGLIRFALACSGGSAQIYIDQVFVSDKVTPGDVDTISLFYESARTAATIQSVSTPSSFTTVTRSTLDGTDPSTTSETFPPTSASTNTPFLPTASDETTLTPTPFLPTPDETTLTPPPPTTEDQSVLTPTPLPPTKDQSALTPTPFNSDASTSPSTPRTQPSTTSQPASCVTGYILPDIDSGYTCHQLGLYRLAYEADRTAFPNQKTSEDCAAICSETSSCKASTYRSQYDKCEFSDELLTDENFVHVESGSYWSEQRCWAQGCLSTATATTTSCAETGYVVEASSSYVCDSFGLYRLAYEADRTAFPNQKTSEDCAAICSQINTCKASTYRSQYDKCEFSDEYLNDDNFFYHESGSIWNEQRCWNPSGCLDGRTATATPTSATATTSASCSETGYVIEASSSYVCNSFGLYRLAYEADRTAFPNQKTSEDCAAICSQINTCKASTYRTQYDKCEFSDEYLNDDNFFYHESESIWNEERCWNPTGCLDRTTTSASTASSTAPACTHTGYVLKENVDDYTCNTFGLYRLSYEADQTAFPNQRTSEDCAAICYQINTCKASTYVAQYDICLFSDEYLDTDNFFYHSTGTYWSEQRCWNPTGCLDAATTATTTAPSSTQSACATGYALATDVDPTYSCNSFGLYRLAYGADSTAFPHQSTSEECAAICAQIRDCKASTYRSQYTTCEFSDEFLDADNFFYHETGSYWFEQRCWDPNACVAS
ncbi:hypothetical protein AK830_g12239 [Neonectria ditissima]|uniref:Apple domain-containing protein n=1 Tax=Neonectria ditissima TaxID=78410 RepID=A0A0P7AKI4_9HYPO|nr:hypothetical protein AK830_g12239 [Neonectria ditissima]